MNNYNKIQWYYQTSEITKRSPDASDILSEWLQSFSLGLSKSELETK